MIRGSDMGSEGESDCEPSIASAIATRSDVWASTDSVAPDGTLQPPAPRRIGRFAILRRIGAGGMGVVYSAYDENLDRRVAIKLLHADALPGSRGEARLQREAQAMARLSHPNVVQVYEVGQHEDRVFIAMEFVEGRTVKDWSRERPRSWREVVGVFVQAGRGLAAAHSAGLVHRDFKPENVLVGVSSPGGQGEMQAAGRVRVLDFGLARPKESMGSPVTRTPDPELERSGSVLSEEVTQAGALVGTPAYMSPEQLRSEPTDARSDQFSFCVALYEGLYGHRPFEGANRIAIGMAVLRGEVRSPPERAAVPKWLHRVVLRGLCTDPAGRYADMHALLSALTQDRSRSRRLWITAATIGIATAGALILHRTMLPPEACRAGPERLVTVWNPARRDIITDALRRTGAGLAEETATRLPATLDAYGQAWVEGYREACEATAVRHDQSQALLDRRMSCLDARLRELEALLEVLEAPDVDIVEHTLTAAANLASVDRCADKAALLADVAPPSDRGTATAVQEVRDALARTRSLRRTGKTALAKEEIGRLYERALAVDYPPLHAEVGYDLGQIALDLGDHEVGIDALREAHWTALRVGDDVLAFDTALLLVRGVGDLQENYETGLHWWRTAEALLERVGDATGDLKRAWLYGHRGTMLYKRGDYAASREDLDRAIAIAEAAEPPSVQELASLVNNRANADLSTGEYAAAEVLYTRALALREDALGPEHPAHVSSLVNLGLVFHKTGRTEQGVDALSRAAGILELTTGSDSVRAGHVNVNLSVMLDDLGREAEARVALERGLAIYRSRLGAEHPNYGMALISRAAMQYAEDDHAGGRRTAQEALQILENAVGPRHPDTVHARIAYADGLSHAEEHEAALAEYEQCLEAWEETFGPEHASTSAPLLGVGRAHLELGDAARALPVLERALRLREEGEAFARDRADVRFALARALWALGRDHDRARSLAERARDEYAAEHGLMRYADEVQQWLLRHPS